jgi:hypothetical protein
MALKIGVRISKSHMTVKINCPLLTPKGVELSANPMTTPLAGPQLIAHRELE